jgi:hypothetical protein
MNILEKEDVFLFIKNCFNASNIVFIFNFLKNDSLTDVNHLDVIDYCKNLSKKIEIRENYLDNDITIYIKK